jgi:hypothetical protein
MNDIERKKREKEKVDKIVKDILKPECDEELSEDEYPKLKDDD